MFDACSRQETVQKSIWDKKPLAVPSWIDKLVERVASDAGVLYMKSEIRVMRAECELTFGGRWFAERNGIGLILNDDKKYTEATLIHELGHWKRWVFGGDEPGEHDEYFYRLMEEMYPEYKISFKYGRMIESAPPARWSTGNKLW